MYGDPCYGGRGGFLGNDTGDRDFAADLESRMAAAGLSVSALADAIGRDRAMVFKWLCRHQRPQCPSRENWERLRKVLPGLREPDLFNTDESGKGKIPGAVRRGAAKEARLGTCGDTSCKLLHSWNGERWECHHRGAA